MRVIGGDLSRRTNNKSNKERRIRITTGATFFFATPFHPLNRSQMLQLNIFFFISPQLFCRRPPPRCINPCFRNISTDEAMRKRLLLNRFRSFPRDTNDANVTLAF